MKRLQYDQLPQGPGAFLIQETGQAYAAVDVAGPVRALVSAQRNPTGWIENFGPLLVEEKIYGSVPRHQKKANFRVLPESTHLLEEIEVLDGPQALLTLADHCFSRPQAECVRLLVDGFVWCLAGLSSAVREGDFRRVSALMGMATALLEVSFPYRQSPLVAQLRGDLQDRLQELEIEHAIGQPSPEDGVGAVAR